MPYTNIKQLLVDAAKYPAAIEAALPTGAPAISTMLVNAAGQIPTVPDFPMEIPDLPAPPALPTAFIPTMPTAARRTTARVVSQPPIIQPSRPAVRFLF